MPFANPEFEIEATFTSATSHASRTIINVHNFTVIKIPFVKLANLTYLTVEGDYAFLSIISSESKSKLEPNCKISIYNLKQNEKNPKDERRGARGSLLFSSNYFVYSTIDEQTESEIDDKNQLQDQTRIYTFILANPIIHWLSTNHDNLGVMDSTTGHNSILGYESYLRSKFKEDAFSFQNLAKDQNMFTYDQILTKSKSDLHIPTDIIQNYKAYNSVAYYYHDDFHIGAISGDNTLTSKGIKNLKSINNISLSFGSVYKLPSVDLFDKNHTDSRMHTSINEVEAGVDTYGIFQKSAATIIVESADGHVETKIPTEANDKRPIVLPGGVIPQDQTVSTDSNHRVIHGKSVAHGEVSTVPKHHVSMYSPDDIDSAVNRYQTTRNLITRDILNYIDMTFQQCYPDLINLTSLYNLDSEARGRFAFLPIAITNIFHKQQSKDARLIHSARVKFIEFYI